MFLFQKESDSVQSCGPTVYYDKTFHGDPSEGIIGSNPLIFLLK